MPLFPDRDAQASFLKETIVKRERTGRNIIRNIIRNIVRNIIRNIVRNIIRNIIRQW